MLLYTKDCSLGKMLVAETQIGIRYLSIGTSERQLIRDFVADNDSHHDFLPTNYPNSLSKIIADVIDGKIPPTNIPLDIQGTTFQKLVWDNIRTIPSGSTLTYAELALKLGKPTATRAVASATAKNQIAFLIPCHRVISNKNPYLYRWGSDIKKQLLQREAQ